MAEPRHGMGDLHSYIGLQEVQLLNCAGGVAPSAVLRPLGAGLGSQTTPVLTSDPDVDAQLMIVIPFRQAIKLHSLVLIAPVDGRAPRVVKLFVNRPHMDMNDAVEGEPTQLLDLSSHDWTSQQPIPLKFVKFQNCTSLSFFVDSNMAGGDVTAITSLSLIGVPIQGMNVNELKKAE